DVGWTRQSVCLGTAAAVLVPGPRRHGRSDGRRGMSRDAEVVVIGAGPSGCAAAIRLAEAGHDVLLLERTGADAAEEIASGELLAPVAQAELAAVAVELPGACLFDRFTGVRNVYPDLSWTLHRLPPGVAWVHVDKGGLCAALRA